MTEFKSGPMPGDGVARANRDGTWSVCRVTSRRELEPIASAPDEESAVKRLRELFPVGSSDQWVVDRSGYARTLN
jgi:hypothetical protein